MMDDMPTKVDVRAGPYPGLSREGYDATAGVSQTMLKSFVSGIEQPRTRTLLVGSAMHARLESKEVFTSQYEPLTKQFNLTTKEGKAAMKEAHEATGKTILNLQEFDLVKAMYLALTKDPVGRGYIESKGGRELCMFSKLNGGGGLLKPHETVCKGIVDLDGKHLWDVKSTHCLNQAEFVNSIYLYGYDAQFAFYRELYAATHNGVYKSCRWLCVSKQPPHEVWWVDADPYMGSGLKWIDTVLTLYERYSNSENK